MKNLAQKILGKKSKKECVNPPALKDKPDILKEVENKKNEASSVTMEENVKPEKAEKLKANEILSGEKVRMCFTLPLNLVYKLKYKALSDHKTMSRLVVECLEKEYSVSIDDISEKTLSLVKSSIKQN